MDLYNILASQFVIYREGNQNLNGSIANKMLRKFGNVFCVSSSFYLPQYRLNLAFLLLRILACVLSLSSVIKNKV